MSSNLWVKEGIYDPTKRFEFTNITKEPFTFSWNSQPITVQAGEKVELPHHLAVLATTRLVDQIMYGEIKAEEQKVKKETHDPNYRSPHGASVAVPAAREPYEKKILRELTRDESKVTESQLGIIRSELKETLTKDIKAKHSPSISTLSEVIPASASDMKAFEEINLPATH